jgi:hypothetical protein
LLPLLQQMMKPMIRNSWQSLALKGGGVWNGCLRPKLYFVCLSDQLTWPGMHSLARSNFLLLVLLLMLLVLMVLLVLALLRQLRVLQSYPALHV